MGTIGLLSNLLGERDIFCPYRVQNIHTFLDASPLRYPAPINAIVTIRWRIHMYVYTCAQLIVVEIRRKYRAECNVIVGDLIPISQV